MEPCAWKLEWNDAMSVGIPETDEEHRQFIRSINDLNLAISSRMELAEIRRRIQLLLDHSESHFEREEALLRQWNYPDADGHAGKHAQTRQALREVMRQCTQDSLEPQWIAAGLEVKKILVNHLMAEDTKHMEYFRASRQAG